MYSYNNYVLSLHLHFAGARLQIRILPATYEHTPKQHVLFIQIVSRIRSSCILSRQEKISCLLCACSSSSKGLYRHNNSKINFWTPVSSSCNYYTGAKSCSCKSRVVTHFLYIQTPMYRPRCLLWDACSLQTECLLCIIVKVFVIQRFCSVWERTSSSHQRTASPARNVATKIL